MQTMWDTWHYKSEQQFINTVAIPTLFASIEINGVRTEKKDKFKNDIKNKINSKLDEEIVKLANERKTKMRFCKNAQRK